jgi:orotate phosphoribosyltransferase
MKNLLQKYVNSLLIFKLSTYKIVIPCCFIYLCSMESKGIAAHVAELLLEVKAIKLSPEKPFKWASGWNSPIYCDNRVALSFPEARTAIKNYLAETIKIHFPEVEAIAGVATAGIPQGALVADLLNLPFIYVRPEPKKHGMGNQIEGKVTESQKVVLIEDLISTGGSSLKAVDALQEANIEVLGMVAIFTYGFPIAAENFAAKNIKLITLSNYEALLPKAVEMGYVTDSQINTLSEWRKEPSVWAV